MKNKKLFITGGAGFLGTTMIKRYYKTNDITVYSRDEAKHYYLKKKYPNINCIIGDVRNRDLMLEASQGHDVGIFAASLKQIEAVDQNVEESVQVLIHGAINSRKCAEKNNFESACFISSDKSRAATTLYGAMKFVAGESFIVNNERTPVKLSSAIYGNVLNSTGSIIPLIWNSIGKSYELTLYSEEMTRFIITPESAVDLIEKALTVDGYNVIPVLKSMLIKDLFEIYAENFGLKYKIGVPRISEKLHEIMVASEEMPRVKTEDGYMLMHYKTVFSEDKSEFSSKDVVMSKKELVKILEGPNYYK